MAIDARPSRAWISAGLVVLAFASAMAVGAMVEHPAQPHTTTSAVDRAGPDGLPWDGRPIAVAFLQPLGYNATRDATLMGAFICSHSPCGPLLWIEGNATGRTGPFLLHTDATRLTIEKGERAPLPEPNPDGSIPASPSPGSPAPYFGANPSQYAPVDEAIAQTFTTTPGLPAAIAASLARVAPLLLLAFAPSGVVWWRRAAIAAAVAAGWMLAVNARTETWGIIGYMMILGILALMAGSVIVLQLARTKRIQPEALAALALVFAFFHALSAIKPYFPVEGGE